MSMTEQRVRQEKRDLKKLLSQGIVLLVVLGFATMMIRLAIGMYEEKHRLHYMYSDCENENIRRESACSKRWVVYPDDTQVRQFKNPRTGQWHDEDGN